MKKILLCILLLLTTCGCSNTTSDVKILSFTSLVEEKVEVLKQVVATRKEQERIVKEKEEQVRLAKEKEIEEKKINQNKPVAINTKIIAIDPGHQASGNNALEPIGPGSSQQKAKVTSGATGIHSNVKESVITLSVSLKLKSILEARGYQVVMTRTSQNVNLSNKERADIANTVGAGAFIRIHCNSYNDSSVSGALTMAPTANNPYCPNIVNSSHALSKHVLNSLCSTTGAKNRGVSYTDTMSGINWCKVPVTIVEMGFLSNPNEDTLLNSEEYQLKMATGIANGIDHYFQ